MVIESWLIASKLWDEWLELSEGTASWLIRTEDNESFLELSTTDVWYWFFIKFNFWDPIKMGDYLISLEGELYI